MSILGEQGSLEEKHLYRLAGGMAAGGEQQGTHCTVLTALLASTTSKKQPAAHLMSLKGYFKFILGVTAEVFG